MVGMPGMLCVCLSYAMGQAVTHALCSIYIIQAGIGPGPKTGLFTARCQWGVVDGV